MNYFLTIISLVSTCQAFAPSAISSRCISSPNAHVLSRLRAEPPSFIDEAQGALQGALDSIGDTAAASDAVTSPNSIDSLGAVPLDPILPNLPKLELNSLPKLNLGDIPKPPQLNLGELNLPKANINLDGLTLPPVNLPTMPSATDIGLTPEAVSTIQTTTQPVVDYLSTIPHLFSVATFLPQIFWLLMIVPKVDTSPVAKAIMKPLTVPILLSLVHLSIVSLSITAEGGTAPMAEFAGVFDPAGDNLGAMSGMMKYPNFVAEEWSHVLTWDLFVGRWIWLDGLRRGVFTPHSVLLTNLIGPPGLLLHVATGILQGKGFPTSEWEDDERAAEE